LDRAALSRQASVAAVSGVTEHQEGDMVSEIQIHTIARQMIEKHSFDAIAQAARNAEAGVLKGDTEEARAWRRREAAVERVRGGLLW
jgi:hypothetical protein